MTTIGTHLTMFDKAMKIKTVSLTMLCRDCMYVQMKVLRRTSMRETLYPADSTLQTAKERRCDYCAIERPSEERGCASYSTCLIIADGSRFWQYSVDGVCLSIQHR
jgi:hypothetical protein